MKHVTLGALALAGVALVTGCADDLVQPTLAPSMSTFETGIGSAGGAQLVVFRATGVPTGFADRVAALGGRVDRAIPAGGAAVVSGLGEAALAALREDPAVSAVEPETLMEMPKVELGAAEALAVAEPESPAQPATAFFFARQWHLRAIQADQAWAAGHLGSADVTVAILDTGIDYRHADLAGRVDLSRSVSFATADDPYVAFYFPGAHPVADIGFHGTHVAATVASNSLAAAGVTSRTTLMGVKVCSVATGGCPGGAIFAGIEHAVENGADIINMSLGGAFQKRVYPGYVSVLNRLFNYAHQNGVTIIVSAGNEAIDLDHALIPDEDTGEIGHYPSLYKTYCSTPNNICVSATGPLNYTLTGPWNEPDAPAVYTNFGRSAINVAAPGGNASYVYAACSGFSLVIPVCRTGTYVVGAAGTSMAAPHTSGVAALILASQGPLSPAQLRAALEGTADDLGQPGTDPFYGKGRVNAARAVGLE